MNPNTELKLAKLAEDMRAVGTYTTDVRKLEPGDAREAAAASLAEDIYLRIICEPAFEKWTLSSRAEFAKRAARIFHGIEK